MKDVDGTPQHGSRSIVATNQLSIPTGPTRMVDALRRPAGRIAQVGIPYGVLVGIDTLCAAIPAHGLFGFTVAVSGLAALGRSLYCAGRIVRQELTQDGSLTNRLAGFVPVQRSVATAAARMLTAEWNRSKIETSYMWGSHGSIGHENRLTSVTLPNGANVTLCHRRGRRPIVLLSTSTPSQHRSVDPKKSLVRAGASIVLDAVRDIQTSRLSVLLGVQPGHPRSTLSHLIAEALPFECKETEEDERIGFDDFISREIEYVIEERRIAGAELTVTAIRRKYREAYLEILVEAPGLGVMTLPPEPFGAIMKRRRSQHLHQAFGAGSPDIMTLPVFLGNARATRIAELARQVLLEDPNLLDSSGSPLRRLVEEHMPRLLATHRDNTATARTSDIAEIDGALDRGLDIVARELGEALDRIADRKLDDLRTELRFLESRHPGQDARLSSIPAKAA